MDITKSGTVRLGDITVNRLGFGAMRITGEGVWGEPKDHDGAIAVLRRAVELGVNFIDTADAYGPEVSENLIREALYPYDGVTIATKGGLTRSGPNEWNPDGSPAHLREAIQGSLKRLGIDRIDVYQFHRPDPNVPFEESIKALVDLQNEGKIRHLGLSNVTVDQLKKAQEMTQIVSVQNRYNIGDAEDSAPVLDYCTEHNIAFIPWFPVGGGGDISRLQSVADRHNASVHQIALAWLLAKSPIMLPIPGTSSVAHLEENIAAATIELSDADLAEL
jgi:pyridoxine 4-dehydrogenase